MGDWHCRPEGPSDTTLPPSREPKRRHKLDWKHVDISTCTLHWMVLWIDIHAALLLLWYLRSSGCSNVASLFTAEKGHTFATHSSLIHDIIGHKMTAFTVVLCNFHMSISHVQARNWVKNCFNFFSTLLSIGSMMLLHFSSPLRQGRDGLQHPSSNHCYDWLGHRSWKTVN